MTTIEDNIATITPPNHAPRYVELDRIPDPLGLLEWVQHFNGKAWFDQEISRGFIDAVAKHKGWNLNRNL